MKRTFVKSLLLVLVAALLIAASASCFAACNVKDAIDGLQEEMSGTAPQPGEKEATLYVDDCPLAVVTSEEYLAGLLRELYTQGMISVLDATDGPYGLTINRVECSVTVVEDGESVTKTGSASGDIPGTYVAIYHTVDNPDLKGTDYVTGAVIEKDALGKTFWYSTLGAESLPLYDGACYRLVTETY